jgi:hypothetical protein
VPESPLPFATRFWFAWICFFRVLFDGTFAARVWQAREPAKLPHAAPARALGRPEQALVVDAAPPKAVTTDPALQLLALLQREGRFIDFIEQDISSFPDPEIGAAARVVHEGCRRALRGHIKLTPVRSEEEGARVTLDAGFSPAEVKLSGNVEGSAPFKGTLRHRGWRASGLTLPTAVAGHDPTVLAPAEVEL